MSSTSNGINLANSVGYSPSSVQVPSARSATSPQPAKNLVVPPSTAPRQRGPIPAAPVAAVQAISERQRQNELRNLDPSPTPLTTPIPAPSNRPLATSTPKPGEHIHNSLEAVKKSFTAITTAATKTTPSTNAFTIKNKFNDEASAKRFVSDLIGLEAPDIALSNPKWIGTSDAWCTESASKQGMFTVVITESFLEKNSEKISSLLEKRATNDIAQSSSKNKTEVSSSALNVAAPTPAARPSKPAVTSAPEPVKPIQDTVKAVKDLFLPIASIATGSIIFSIKEKFKTLEDAKQFVSELTGPAALYDGGSVVNFGTSNVWCRPSSTEGVFTVMIEEKFLEDNSQKILSMLQPHNSTNTHQSESTNRTEVSGPALQTKPQIHPKITKFFPGKLVTEYGEVRTSKFGEDGLNAQSHLLELKNFLKAKNLGIPEKEIDQNVSIVFVGRDNEGKDIYKVAIRPEFCEKYGAKIAGVLHELYLTKQTPDLLIKKVFGEPVIVNTVSGLTSCYNSGRMDKDAVQASVKKIQKALEANSLSGHILKVESHRIGNGPFYYVSIPVDLVNSDQRTTEDNNQLKRAIANALQPERMHSHRLREVQVLDQWADLDNSLCQAVVKGFIDSAKLEKVEVSDLVGGVKAIEMFCRANTEELVKAAFLKITDHLKFAGVDVDVDSNILCKKNGNQFLLVLSKEFCQTHAKIIANSLILVDFI